MKPSAICPNWRYDLVKYTVFIFYAVVIIRLFQIQVLNSSRYKAQAREQQWQGYPIQARRGTIYTADNYPVATVSTEYLLFVDMTRIVDDTLSLYNLLSPYVPGLDKSYVVSLENSGKRWVKLAEGLTWEQKRDIESLGIPGISFEETYKRFYPEATLLGHVLGFVGGDEAGNSVGYYGLERYYDGDLQGQNGWIFQEKSAHGDPILWGDQERIEPVDGSDIYLTVDRYVQFIIETSLKEGVKAYGAKSGTAIVVNPSSGAVLAMANFPEFNPVEYKEEAENVRNNAISSIYEPGSVVKAMTMSAAIDSGKVTPETVYNDTGPRYFSGHKVDNWDGKHHGEETMVEILQHSNNLGAAWVGLQLGGKNLMEYFSAFGFGRYTNIDLNGEEKGIIYKRTSLRDIEVANAAFGQGISITPLQLAMAFSAIANNGYYMKPYIVEKIKSASGSVQTTPQVVDRPISSATADIVVDMLVQAVSGGEAKFFVLKGYNIAGKTGTAQVPVKGGYDPYRTNATFVGFFPSYRNFVMLVKLEEPTFPSGYAAETAVPLWMKIAEKLANYYGLAPDK